MSTSKKKETYSQAMERLEKIVRQIDNKLTKADKEIEKLLSEKRECEE